MLPSLTLSLLLRIAHSNCSSHLCTIDTVSFLFSPLSHFPPLQQLISSFLCIQLMMTSETRRIDLVSWPSHPSFDKSTAAGDLAMHRSLRLPLKSRRHHTHHQLALQQRLRHCHPSQTSPLAMMTTIWMISIRSSSSRVCHRCHHTFAMLARYVQR